MKKLVFASILFALLFSGCKEKTDYAGLLVGKWVSSTINGEPPVTNDVHFCEYRADGVELYASGIQLDQVNKTWIENDKYEYSVDGNIITIDGTDDQHNIYHIEFAITSLDENTLTHTVRNYSYNGVAVVDTNIYSYRKVTTDYQDQFTGIWYGRCVTPGTTDPNYHYWEYLANGSFNYYYQNAASQWIRKSDSDGGYFLYGNLLVCNYTNDLILGSHGKAYECWYFDIEGTNMTCTSLDSNNSNVTYEVVKVSNPPTVIN